MNDEINIHPADELAALREEIKIMQEREEILRSALMNGSAEEREGRQYTAYVQVSNRETIDKASLIAALGREVVEPFIKHSEVKSLKLAAKSQE